MRRVRMVTCHSSERLFPRTVKSVRRLSSGHTLVGGFSSPKHGDLIALGWQLDADWERHLAVLDHLAALSFWGRIKSD